MGIMGPFQPGDNPRETVGELVGCVQGRQLSVSPLIIPNKEIKDILEINKYLEESGLLKKDISKTIENEAK